MASNTPADGSELATAYHVLAANTIDNTFSLRKTLAIDGSRGLDSAKVFSDVLASDTLKSYATANPGKSLTATTSEQTLTDGTPQYRVSLRDRDGGGIDYTVDSHLSVGVTPIQGFSDGHPSIALPTENFRWNAHNDRGDGSLEHAIPGPGHKPTFVPYANPSLSAGDDAEAGVKLLADQGISTYGSGRSGRPPVLLAAEAPASNEGVRAVSGHGNFGKLENGYSQQGPVVYNGFSVVEQSGANGEKNFYNKHDLLRNASGRPEFDKAIASGKPVDISVENDSAHIRPLETRTPDLHVFRNGHQETLSAGFSQTGKLFDYGVLVGQETDTNGRKAMTIFSKKELLEHRNSDESKALQEAILHHHSVTINLSQHSLSVHVPEQPQQHATTQARTKSVTIDRAPGLERGSP